jgi:hypothetical protein
MVGYAEYHSPHTYKVFKYVPNGPGEIIITGNLRWEHWDHPYKSQSSFIQPQSIIGGKLKPSTTRTYGKMIDDYIVENKLCPMEYWTTPTKKTDKTDNYNLRRKKNDSQRKKHDPQRKKEGREAYNEEEDGFIMVSNKKAARRTPPT